MVSGEGIRAERIGTLLTTGLLQARVLEARGGIEPPLRVLQTHALPLGYRALLRIFVPLFVLLEQSHQFIDQLH